MAPKNNDPLHQFETPEGIRIDVNIFSEEILDGERTMDFVVTVHSAPGYTVEDTSLFWRKSKSAGFEILTLLREGD